MSAARQNTAVLRWTMSSGQHVCFSHGIETLTIRAPNGRVPVLGSYYAPIPTITMPHRIFKLVNLFAHLPRVSFASSWSSHV